MERKEIDNNLNYILKHMSDLKKFSKYPKETLAKYYDINEMLYRNGLDEGEDEKISRRFIVKYSVIFSGN